jgi:CRISPR-associated protein Cmr4
MLGQAKVWVSLTLPIARAKATNLLIVAGSALKGVLRDEAETQLSLNQEQIKTLFGPVDADATHAGAVALVMRNYYYCQFVLLQVQ